MDVLIGIGVGSTLSCFAFINQAIYARYAGLLVNIS